MQDIMGGINLNLNEVIEQEQLEADRKKLMNESMTLDDIKWKFIEELVIQSKDKKISNEDMTLIYKYTERIKKELEI